MVKKSRIRDGRGIEKCQMHTKFQSENLETNMKENSIILKPGVGCGEHALIFK